MSRLAILILLFLAASEPLMAQTVPPDPDTSAAGSVSQMIERLSAAQSQLDSVSAAISRDQVEIGRLQAGLASTRAKGDEIVKDAKKVLDDFNLKVTGFNAACGHTMREESQEYEDCLHSQSDLKHRKDELTHQTAEWQRQLDDLRNAFLSDSAKMAALQGELRRLSDWKGRVVPAMEALRRSISAKCVPLKNCPAF